MKHDIFLSICQTDVDGYMPSEKVMFQNFFDQAELSDELGFGTAWIAETHLSCQVQKENPDAVIPHFKGEIGLNTDILQMAQRVFTRTKKIKVGSAIRNIICNGGPIAHAEAIRTFLTLQSLEPGDQAERKLEIGFAAGRFPFSNIPYGFYPKTELEKAAWEIVKNKYFQQATEVFLRFLSGEKISSFDLADRYLERKDFRTEDHWQLALRAADVSGAALDNNRIKLNQHWQFPKVGVIPFDVSLQNIKLTIGSHDPETQILANKILPVGVFNLSITPEQVIEETHQRMREHYHKSAGPWRREFMPRTVMLFIDKKGNLAKERAERAWKNYWTAMEKTLDLKKVEGAVSNTIAGDTVEVFEKLQQKYHPDDRLMLWFDFNNHDNDSVKESMRLYMEEIAPKL
jgi:alkanesulfonate monooxygenase SsuD/methylene tetrahydromethanopterin reductase-like flavin-dependent oxidoreductase (luciferase family)